MQSMQRLYLTDSKDGSLTIVTSGPIVVVSSSIIINNKVADTVRPRAIILQGFSSLPSIGVIMVKAQISPIGIAVAVAWIYFESGSRKNGFKKLMLLSLIISLAVIAIMHKNTPLIVLCRVCAILAVYADICWVLSAFCRSKVMGFRHLGVFNCIDLLYH